MGPRRWLVVIPLIVGLTACGNQASMASGPSAPPDPQRILQRIDKSGLEDAHFAVTEDLPDGSGGSAHGTGEGLLVLKPTAAERRSVTFAVSGLTLETIAIGNAFYYRKSNDQNWTQARGQSAMANLSSTYDLRLVGEEQTPQGKIWHISGINMFSDPFEIWTREKDGYPLKYTSHGPKVGTESLVFDGYNTGQTISPPPSSQVVSG